MIFIIFFQTPNPAHTRSNSALRRLVCALKKNRKNVTDSGQKLTERSGGGGMAREGSGGSFVDPPEALYSS